MSDSLRNTLRDGADLLNQALTDDQEDALLNYVYMLEKWNRVYNLTSVRRPIDMIKRHILDSMTILPYIDGGRLLDIGTGAGLPGIVLGVMRPGLEVTLLDSNGKKMRFCQQVIADTSLSNVKIVNERYGEYHPEQAFNYLTARAFGSLDDLIKNAPSICAPGAQLLAMKGHYPYAEIEAVSDMPYNAEPIELKVPMLDAERYLIRVTIS